MSFPQASESGDPPPPHGPTDPWVQIPPGPGTWSQSPDPWPQGPGMQVPGYQSPHGHGLAVATLVCGALILPGGFAMLGPAMFAMLFTRPDTGSNGKEWVANVVFYSLPALFVLLCLIFGILAVRRSLWRTSVRRISTAGLIVGAVETAIIVWPLFVGEFDAFS